MKKTELKKMLASICLTGLLAGSGVGVTACNASG
jgi:radical SAM modification target selenobiotic family peptide